MWQDTVMAKRPRDPIKLAKQVFDIAIGETEDHVWSLQEIVLLAD